MGYIYKIKNNINNKYYIGQTIHDLQKRFNKHKQTSSNCIYLKNAFNKYGSLNFTFELICICFDTDLNYYESYYIKKYNSLVPNGYNLKNGGNNGKMHSYTKEKISNTLKNKNYKYPIGTHPFIGKYHTNETKQKISNALTGRILTQITKDKIRKYAKCKKVIKCDLDNNIINIYPSCNIAAKQNNTTKSAISMVCNNKRQTLYNYKYMYENNMISELFNEINNLKL